MNINNCIAENCLSNLVSSPYFVEDVAGVDLTFLANSASPSGISGAQCATNLINTASRLMLGDLEMILTSEEYRRIGIPTTISEDDIDFDFSKVDAPLDELEEVKKQDNEH